MNEAGKKFLSKVDFQAMIVQKMSYQEKFFESACREMCGRSRRAEIFRRRLQEGKAPAIRAEKRGKSVI